MAEGQAPGTVLCAWAATQNMGSVSKPFDGGESQGLYICCMQDLNPGVQHYGRAWRRGRGALQFKGQALGKT